MPALPDRLEEARVWLSYARANLAHAAAGRAADVLAEYLCFDAQQAAEKALKAALIVHNVRPPRVHDLGELLRLLSDAHVNVPADVQRAEDLSAFAVQARYPGWGDRVEDEDVSNATATAEAVIVWVAELIELGSPPE